MQDPQEKFAESNSLVFGKASRAADNNNLMHNLQICILRDSVSEKVDDEIDSLTCCGPACHALAFIAENAASASYSRQRPEEIIRLVIHQVFWWSK